MTSNAQDYLKLIYEESAKHKKVTNKVIVNKLGISPPSVTEMLTKLDKQGFIKYTPYKGSFLTEKGLKSCCTLIKSHRLWEVFLIRHLGYSWSDAHEEANLLEHIMTVRMLERLDKFLNYPKYCPHGYIIPREDGVNHSLNLISLKNLNIGDSGFIRSILEEKELMDYIQKIGLKIGDNFTLEKIDPYEGPYHILVENKRIQISFKATLNIFVEF